MVAIPSNESEIYRLIVLRRMGTEILLAPDQRRWVLPSVEIPRWQRVAENLTDAVRACWGEEIICLFEPDSGARTKDTGIRYQVAEHWCTCGSRRPLALWIPVSRLSQPHLTDPADYDFIRLALGQCATSIETSLLRPFATLGWFKDLNTWVDMAARRRGLRLNGKFRQLNASPSFSLVRLETDGPALWFKAVGPPNQREFPLTCRLSQLFPGYLPQIIATHPDWSGWLAWDVEGKPLCDEQKILSWESAAGSLARLQLESIGYGGRIRAAGAHDMSTSALSNQIQPFMETMSELMERQTKPSPPALSRQQLVLLGEDIQDALEAYGTLEIPETLGHLDLNPGNIMVSIGGCVFLDWADAYVGNPFLSLEYLRQHLRRSQHKDPSDDGLIRAYCEPWRKLVPSTAIAEALVLAPLLAVFAYAAGNNAWRGLGDQPIPAAAAYLRSLTRHMWREAHELRDRRLLCANG
jgi:hypothetical protein